MTIVLSSGTLYINIVQFDPNVQDSFMGRNDHIRPDEAFDAGWYAGYLRGLASQPGIPLETQDKWTAEDYAEFRGNDGLTD